jgi:TolB-like protein/DNA-binding winged helix-turn-helix (wHTH) protein
MDTSPSSPARFRFDEFEVDGCMRELRKKGERIRLQEQPLQVLLFLIQRPGQLVTREELHAEIWPKGTFVDFDHGLNTAIKKIRVALGDSANIPRYVETIPRRGYRFLAPVETVSDEDCAKRKSADVLSAKFPQGLASQLFRLGRPAVIWLVPASALALLYFLLPFSVKKNAASPRRIVLVVLPFENLSGDAAQDYLCQGFSEELETQLGRADPEGLAVVARVTAAAYSRNRTVAEIGRDLHADYVLEGSVRGDAHYVRVTAQLIRVTDQSHIWANEYDRELGSIIAVQNEVAQSIVEQVRSSIRPGSRAWEQAVAVE